MFDRLEDLVKRLEEVMEELSEPDVVNDQARFRNLMKEQNELTPIVEKYNEYKDARQTFFSRKTRTMTRTLSWRSVPAQAEMKRHFSRRKSIVCISLTPSPNGGKPNLSMSMKTVLEVLRKFPL